MLMALLIYILQIGDKGIRATCKGVSFCRYAVKDNFCYWSNWSWIISSTLSWPTDCGYILSDIFGWKQGLSKKFNQAKAFYLVISLSTIAGLCINFLNLNPIKALVYANVINGVVAIPVLVAIVMITNDKKILGLWINRKISNIIGWSTIVMMGISVVIMFLTWKK